MAGGGVAFHPARPARAAALLRHREAGEISEFLGLADAPDRGSAMNFDVTTIRHGIAVLLLAAIAGWLVAPVAAQRFPSGPVHIIVPLATGGLTMRWRGSPPQSHRFLMTLPGHRDATLRFQTARNHRVVDESLGR